MSEPKKNPKKKFLIVLVFILLIGACFGGVAIYMNIELNKPKFKLGDTELPSVTALPASKTEAYEYVKGLYEAAVSSDAVECSWHTEAKLKDYGDPLVAPFSDADKDLILYIWEHAEDDDKAQFRSLYPSGEKVGKSAENGIFGFDITEAQVLDFSATQGRKDDDGNDVELDYYFITLSVDPAVIDPASVTEGEPYKKMLEKFSSALTVNKADVTVKSVSMTFKVARYYDELASFEITRAYGVKADVTFTDAYAALAEGGPQAQIELPYQTTEKIGFKYYGAHFTQTTDARQVDDMRALPVRVNVKDNASRENGDYTLDIKAYNGDKDVTGDIVSIDDDGVLTVNKACSDPLTLKMKLLYEGHEYKSEMTLYITELEVETGNG